MKKSKTNKLEKFSDEELYTELNRRNADKELLQYKVLDIGGFTSKDVVCVQGCQSDWQDEQNGYKDECGPHYYFYLKVDGKLFDVYYQHCATDKPNGNRDKCDPSRWPVNEEDEDSYASLSLVPKGFAESAENMYEYHGETDVEAYLKKYGVTDYRVWDPKKFEEKTGRDANYDV